MRKALLDAAARLRMVSGQILLEGATCWRCRSAVAMIFQAPMSSLNPVLSVGDKVLEALRLHQPLSAAAAAARAVELLDLVKLPEPQRRFHDFPHQLSASA